MGLPRILRFIASSPAPLPDEKGVKEYGWRGRAHARPLQPGCLLPLVPWMVGT